MACGIPVIQTWSAILWVFVIYIDMVSTALPLLCNRQSVTLVTCLKESLIKNKKKLFFSLLTNNF